MFGEHRTKQYNVLGDDSRYWPRNYNPLAGDDWDDFEEDTERLPADTQEEIARQFNRAILGISTS